MVKTSQRTGMWGFKFEALGIPPSSPAQGDAAEAKPVNDMRKNGIVTDWLVMNFHIEKRTL